MKPKLTFAFCTYNRVERLRNLVAAMRAQSCPVPFEILAVNNNSDDETVSVLERLSAEPGPRLRWVTEETQGIVAARNRAIEESLASDIMVFIDDDEIPHPGFLEGAAHAILKEGAQCVGGRVEVDFSPHGRPRWLGDDLMGFLAEVDHGTEPFWITDASTPIWTANIAYDMSMFRNDPGLRFDQRYDRKGKVVGGGEDVIMLRELLKRQVRIRYRPDMVVKHGVEPWRLRRSYFLQVHYRAGVREGQYETLEFETHFFGVPPFLLVHLIRHSIKTVGMWFGRRPGVLRQAMTAAHSLGVLLGYRRRDLQAMAEDVGVDK